MKNRLLDYLSSAPPTDRDPGGERDLINPRRLADAAEEWIVQNPGVALGAALAVGVFVGWLVKRK
jgi:ElaB/YqjD/DUF883 family membrane-anchored ribosome-binding protein